MRRSFILAFLIVLIAGFTISENSTAYTLFSGDNNCDQCHTGFDGYGSSTHQSHIAAMSCNACHESNGDNANIATCSACHDSNLLWNYHLQYAENDLNGMDCSACHSVTPNENESWDSIKSRYRDAVVSR